MTDPAPAWPDAPPPEILPPDTPGPDIDPGGSPDDLPDFDPGPQPDPGVEIPPPPAIRGLRFRSFRPRATDGARGQAKRPPEWSHRRNLRPAPGFR